MNDKEVYKKSLDLFDGCCAICRNPNVAMHHIRYGGLRGGRKTYYGNVIPLCPYHHNIAHSNKEKFMNQLIEIIDERMENYDRGYKEKQGKL